MSVRPGLLFLASQFLAACTAAPRSATQSSRADITFLLSSHAEVHVAVELALDEPSRARGLMDRRALAPGTGMVFVFPEISPHKFWMHNTYIPLDMIFVGADRRVVYVEDRAEPLTETPRGPDAPTQFVVEVPGGWAKSHGIEPGTSVRFTGVPGVSP
ncbi:MAG: DUF192 domain-containing protein [Polyangia bacterium]